MHPAPHPYRLADWMFQSFELDSFAQGCLWYVQGDSPNLPKTLLAKVAGGQLKISSLQIPLPIKGVCPNFVLCGMLHASGWAVSCHG